MTNTKKPSKQARRRAQRREAAKWNEAMAAAEKILSPEEIAAEAARIAFPPPRRPKKTS